MSVRPYVYLDKQVGQTPLACAEAWRSNQPAEYQGIPLAYAGRLDPMASGKLLLLIGDTCKDQERYHGLDKAYEFSVLCGISSDTGDVLGRLQFDAQRELPAASQIKKSIQKFIGPIALPYPAFSSKTVKGKPLHTWTLEGRLQEIEIPLQHATIYQLKLVKSEVKYRTTLASEARAKIDTIPPVTDTRKAIGNDFRRSDIRADWEQFKNSGQSDDQFTILHFYCVCSSGAYMRSLAEAIGKELGTIGLAYHIHRTAIGRYHRLPFIGGFFTRGF